MGERIRITNPSTPMFDGKQGEILRLVNQGVITRLESGHTTFFFHGEYERLGYGYITGTADIDEQMGELWRS